MQACGVIVEYNPFHNGHVYHLQKARELSKADVVIAVMSGNFLQRGEPAVIDKWKRAEEALANGADLVIELPMEWAVQSADYFAKGAVAILQALGCESLCFGTDSEESFDYEGFGYLMVKEKEKIKQLFQKIDQPTLSYPEKMTLVLQQFFSEWTQGKTGPNHILGLSYSQENSQYPKPLRLLPVQRKQAAYHSKDIQGEIASATAIRHALKEQVDISNVVPQETALDLLEYQVSWEDFWPYLKYQLTIRSYEELQQIYQMNEGIEYRLKEAGKQANHFTEFMQLVKTKRYTQTRIQRLCCYLLLGIKKEEIRGAWEKNHLRVLGFTAMGKDYLKTVKKKSDLPILSKIGKQEALDYPLGIRSDQVYQMGKSAISEQNFGRFPIQK